ncbi:MAG: helix-turn-helix domain-containing protein [Bacteroidetes bacterium]|nr:helix-turn-helix domain-containing protein [Bacteroidota bacterium]
MKPRPPDFIERLEVFAIERLSEPEHYNSSAVAGLFSADPRTVRKWMKELVAMCPNDYLRRFRMEVAAVLLRGALDVALRDVCHAVGLQETDKFCHRFKSYFGMMPLAYRNLYREENFSRVYVLRGGLCFTLSRNNFKIRVLRGGGN